MVNRLGEIRDRSFEQQRYRASGLKEAVITDSTATEAGFLSPSSKQAPYSALRQVTQQGYLQAVETIRKPR